MRKNFAAMEKSIPSQEKPGLLGRYLVRGVSWSLTLKIGGVVLALASNIVLARSLGPDEFGAYAFIISIFAFLNIPITLGLPEFLVREIAKFKVKQQWRPLKGLLLRANQSVLLFAGGGTLALAIIMSYSHWEEGALFFIALPLLVINSLNSIREATLRGLQHVILGQLPDTTIKPLLFLFLIFVLWLAGARFDVAQVMGLQVFCALTAFLVGTFFVVKAMPESAKRANGEYATRLWLRGALPFLFLGSVYFINNQVDIVMLGLMRSNAEVGIYKIAVQGAQLVIFILMAVNTTIGPVISELYDQKQLEKLKRVITLSARTVLAGSLPVGLVFILWGKPLVSFVFGAQYAGASVPLSILCVGQVVNAGMGSVGLILNMTGNEQDTLKGLVVSAVLNVGLNGILIPRFGVEGAAWATTISMVFWNLLLSGFVFKRLGIWANAYSKA